LNKVVRVVVVAVVVAVATAATAARFIKGRELLLLFGEERERKYKMKCGLSKKNK
jgi:hypothetical protein